MAVGQRRRDRRLGEHHGADRILRRGRVVVVGDLEQRRWLRSERLRLGGGRAEITYDYTVASKQYRGDRVSYELTSCARVNELVEKYPVGAAATVYFDPGDPSAAVLERGARESNLWYLAAAVFSLLLGLALVVVSRNERWATKLYQSWGKPGG